MRRLDGSCLQVTFLLKRELSLDIGSNLLVLVPVGGEGGKPMTIEELHEKVKHMNPIDDLFMKKMVEDRNFCQEVIWAATGDKSIVIVSNDPQAVVSNLQGRSVILDVRCIDGEGKNILIEIQKSDDDNHVYRVRYNASVTTANITDPGTKFEKVPRILSIYITKNDFIAKLALEQGFGEEDVLSNMSAVYHVDRIVRETGQILDNGMEEIYVNGKVKDGSDASDMMTIFTEDEAYDHKKFPAISKRKWQFKNNEKEVGEMGYSYEEIKNEGRAEGREDVLKALLEDGTITPEKADDIRKKEMAKATG